MSDGGCDGPRADVVRLVSRLARGGLAASTEAVSPRRVSARGHRRPGARLVPGRRDRGERDRPRDADPKRATSLTTSAEPLLVGVPALIAKPSDGRDVTAARTCSSSPTPGAVSTSRARSTRPRTTSSTRAARAALATDCDPNGGIEIDTASSSTSTIRAMGPACTRKGPPGRRPPDHR